MGWLSSVGREVDEVPFGGRKVAVERRNSGEFVTEYFDGHDWVCTYPAEHIPAHKGGTVGTFQILAGHELMSFVSCRFGVLWRPNDTDELVIARPHRTRPWQGAGTPATEDS